MMFHVGRLASPFSCRSPSEPMNESTKQLAITPLLYSFNQSLLLRIDY